MSKIKICISYLLLHNKSAQNGATTDSKHFWFYQVAEG